MLVKVPGGVVIRADCFGTAWLPDTRAALAVADPPYGGIVSESWDKIGATDLAQGIALLSDTLTRAVLPGGHFCLWGGIGSPRNRALFLSILLIEEAGLWEMAAFNTWRKKRAYGTKWQCLLAREEMARFVLGEARKPRVYNVQYENTLRGYAGFNKDYPAKDARKRLTMVWDHASDMARDKPHKCHKPRPLCETIVSMCTNPGELVLDLFSGGGELSMTARELDRPFVAVELDPENDETFDRLVERLRNG